METGSRSYEIPLCLKRAVDVSQLGAVASYLGTNCNPALSGPPSPFPQFCSEGSFLCSVTPASGAGPSHIYMDKLLGCHPLPPGFLCVRKDRRNSRLPSLELHLQPFPQGRRPPGATQEFDRSLSVEMCKCCLVGDRPHQEEGRRRISPQAGFSRGWCTYIHSSHPTKQRTSVSTFSYRIPPPAHIRNTLSLAADPTSSLGSYPTSPFCFICAFLFSRKTNEYIFLACCPLVTNRLEIRLSQVCRCSGLAGVIGHPARPWLTLKLPLR